MTFIILTLALVGCSSTKDNAKLSTEEKVEDFEYMYEVIKDGYPYLDVNKRLNKVDWLKYKKRYLKQIKKTKNDKEFIEVMSSIVSELNNGHTHVIDNETYNFLKDIYSKLGWYDFWKDKNVLNRYESLGSNKGGLNDFYSDSKLTLKDVIKEKIGYIHIPQMTPRNESIKEDMKIIENILKL